MAISARDLAKLRKEWQDVVDHPERYLFSRRQRAPLMLALLDERKALRAALTQLRYDHDIDCDPDDSKIVADALALGEDEEDA